MAAGVTATASRCPNPPAPRAPSLPLPDDACDSHAHVFGPVDTYSYSDDAHYRPADRAYVPPDVTVGDFRAHLDALGLRRAVLVQPNIYGTDHRCLTDALARLQGWARGIAVLPFSVSEAELWRLHHAGVRGVRLHGVGAHEMADLRHFARRLVALGWHLQVFAPLDWIAANADALQDLPCPVVFDHFAGLKAEAPNVGDNFRRVLRLVSDGPGWVKLSGPFRATAGSIPNDALGAYARALAELAPHRLVWGSDWPYLRVAAPLPTGGDLLEALAGWIKSPELMAAVLRDNPRALYGFDAR
jgi:predicted TIM-barrel fold metal-dependent hydrolase